MPKLLLSALILIALSLGGCVTGKLFRDAVYKPIDEENIFGYKEVQTGPNSYQIVYQEDRIISWEDIKSNALKRAGELAVSNNYEYFEVKSSIEQLVKGREIRYEDEIVAQKGSVVGKVYDQATFVLPTQYKRLLMDVEFVRGETR